MKTFALLLCLSSLVACAAPPSTTAVSSAAVTGFVTDRTAFDQFIATRPTAAAFRARYPDVTLALPGSINTKEFRSNNSRFFAELDAEGRISGGRFQ